VKVAIYARVSTADQNPELQLSRLREYAAARNFTIHREYVDQTTGAVEKRTKHTAYDELLADARLLKFRCVLVWKFDRFARSLPALLDALQTFQALGIDFISATQAIDTTTPMGRLFFSVVGAFGEFERELIAERSRIGIENARRKGVVFGRPRDPDVEKRIQRLKQRGIGIRAIAKSVSRSPAGVMRILERLSR
jgi:DNA invertase Pin-like site-specific DNA recombinase